MHDNVERSFYYYVPKKHQNQKQPLIISLHGGGKADGDEYGAQAGYRDLADRAGFIIVHPNGIESQWNDGRGITYNLREGNENIDDVGFISKVIDYFIEKYNADPSRIFIEGTSNGGMMTQRLACELSHKITAAASNIANMPLNIHKKCSPKHSVPMLLINGTADPIIPWEGGFVKIGKKSIGEVISTYETIKFWIENNKCNSKSETILIKDRIKRDKSSIRKHIYACQDNAQVVLYEVVNGGHNRPNPKGWTPVKLLGYQNRDITTAVEVWKFFRQF
ncbi:MAG: prolyl oligopeptidase family serine peptidase [Alphaproteobacteria bacterium]|nr:prolyl oligopeptidase family serine peptidase [Alphaproteobacteria bacterium]